MTSFTRFLSGAAAAALLCGNAQAATDLIVNGGFEANPTPSGGYIRYFGGDTFTGWTVTGADVLNLNTTYSENAGDGNGAILTFNAHSGSSAMDLTGAGNTSPADGIYQDVATDIGKRYKLSFYLGNAAAGPSVGYYYPLASTLGIAVTGQSPASDTNSATTLNAINWQLYSSTFVATNTTTRIAFTNETGLADNYAGLDDVSLTAVPEPATWAMMVMGFLGMGGAVRASRRRALLAA